MKSLSKIIIVCLCSIAWAIGTIIACTLPPDIIHEFRIDTASGGNARVHYSLMAWKNLHTEILDTISRETGITANSENLDTIYKNYLIKNTELYINDKPVDLVFLSGAINAYQWSGNDMASYNPESLIEIDFETDFSSEIHKKTSIRLEFRKDYFRNITSLIHAYVYTDIQKYGTQWSYIIGEDDRSYFPTTFLGKTYWIRNTLDEQSDKNTFILYIEPNILDHSKTITTASKAAEKNTSWFNVWETLQVFFHKQSSIWFQMLGLGIAILAGMIHGLLPGHSKVLIGTYMIGNSSLRYKDIFTLIGSVTFSHTIFIFILATIVLILQKWLSTVSQYVITFSAIGYILFWIYFYYRWTRTLKNIEHPPAESIFKQKHLHTPDCNCNEISEKKWLRWTTLTGLLAWCNPCIDALALFIFAITIWNAVYALFMILFFSLGLWLMLGIIAFWIKKSKILLEKKSQQFAEKVSAHITILSWIGIILMWWYILLK